MIITSFVSSFHYVQIAAFYSEEKLQRDNSTLVVYQVIFCADLIINFFTEHHSNKSPMPIRSQRRIAIIYLRGRFMLDVIALVPFDSLAESLIGLSTEYGSLFLLIKLVRIIVGFKLLHY